MGLRSFIACSALRRAVFFGAVVAEILVFSSIAQAELRLGGNVGFGGTGLSTTSSINGVDVPVSRSDGPLAFNLSVEYPFSYNSTGGLDYTRGVTMSPFSAGVSFIGYTYRYYYPNLMPSMVKSKEDKSTLLVSEYAPFFGPTIGLAQGQISRQKDLVSDVTASGIFIGFHAGLDIQKAPNWVTRYEMVTGQTMAAAGGLASTLSEFVLQVGVYYIWE